MAVNYDASVENSRITESRDAVANGTLEIGTAGMASVLATFGLSASGGSIAGDTWTLAFDASTVTASATGTAAAAQIKDSTGTVRISGLTVGTSGADINFDSVAFNATQNVTLSTASIQHA